MPAPTTRVLALLELLQAHNRLSGAELAERLGVDRRTVRRYITVLEDLGIPVVTDQGRHGGYRLVAGFKLPPMMFTDAEAQVLSLGLLAVRQAQLLDADAAVESVQAKLQRVMPEALKQRVRALHENISLVLRREPLALLQDTLLQLAEAAQLRRRVRLLYQAREGGMVVREVDPWGLVFRWGRWYLGGWCHLRGAMRSFRLDRMQHVGLLEQSFERPADFDAAKYLNESLRSAWRQHPVSVLLHADLKRVNEVLCEMSGVLEPHEEGVVMNSSTDSYHWFAWWLMQLPFDFRILGPEPLREAMRGHIARLAASCGDTAPKEAP